MNWSYAIAATSKLTITNYTTVDRDGNCYPDLAKLTKPGNSVGHPAPGAEGDAHLQSIQ
jgi:hypothetical protein